MCWEMDPGDVIVFDGMTVRGAKANSSAVMRRGYAVRFTGDGMTYHSDKEVNKIIVNPHLKDGSDSHYGIIFMVKNALISP